MVDNTMAVAEGVKTVVQLLMKRPITEEIALQVEAVPGFEHLEIENGEWVGFDEDEYMGGEEHGRIEYKLLLRIGNHVEANNLGMLYPGDTDFVLDGVPRKINIKRRPDVAFVATQNVKRSQGYYYGAPDLAVEIISPSERPGNIRQKLREYLDHGVQQVWQVFPDVQEIVVHFPDDTSRTYRVGDTIPGGDLLPGFTLKVSDVFGE